MLKIFKLLALITLFSPKISFACSCAGPPNLEKLTEESFVIYAIEITSIETLTPAQKSARSFSPNDYEVVTYEVTDAIKGTKITSSGHFVQSRSMCSRIFKAKQNFLYFNPKDSVSISDCNYDIMENKENIRSLSELQQYAHKNDIERAASSIRTIYSLCASRKVSNCQGHLELIRNKVCKFGTDNPSECNNI